MLAEPFGGVKRAAPARGVGRVATPRGREPYLACGRHAVRAFLAARPGAVARVLVARGTPEWLEAELRNARLTAERTEPAVLERLAGGLPHQGVVALGEPPAALPLEGVRPERFPLLVAFDGVTDPRNVGAVMRSAEAAGVAAVILPRDRSPGWAPALVKAAAGAVEWLPVAHVTNLARALTTLRERGYWVVGLDAAAVDDLYDPGAVPGLPCVLVVGAEDSGIRPLIRRSCHRLLRIPMEGRTESLNVSVASALALFELRRLFRLGALGA